VLTALGVFLTTYGVLDSATFLTLSGALMAMVSGIWSVFDKTDGQMIKKLETFQAKMRKK
jgi:hypothetical protein